MLFSVTKHTVRQNDLSFSLCTTPSMCHLVATLDNEMEFEIVNTDRVKCVTLRLEFSVHSSRNYSQLSD